MSEMPVAVPPRPVGAWVANVSLFLLTGVFTTIMSQWLVVRGRRSHPRVCGMVLGAVTTCSTASCHVCVCGLLVGGGWWWLSRRRRRRCCCCCRCCCRWRARVRMYPFCSLTPLRTAVRGWRGGPYPTTHELRWDGGRGVLSGAMRGSSASARRGACSGGGWWFGGTW